MATFETNLLLAQEKAMPLVMEALMEDYPEDLREEIYEAVQATVNNAAEAMAELGDDQDKLAYLLMLSKADHLSVKIIFEQYTLQVLHDLVNSGEVKTDGEGNFQIN